MQSKICFPFAFFFVPSCTFEKRIQFSGTLFPFARNISDWQAVYSISKWKSTDFRVVSLPVTDRKQQTHACLLAE